MVKEFYRHARHIRQVDEEFLTELLVKVRIGEVSPLFGDGSLLVRGLCHLALLGPSFIRCSPSSLTQVRRGSMAWTKS